MWALPGVTSSSTKQMQYTTVANDSCSAIGVKFSITVANIETWNADTFHWNGLSFCVGDLHRLTRIRMQCSASGFHDVCLRRHSAAASVRGLSCADVAADLTDAGCSIIAGLQCGPQSQGNLTCPLNACCSAFGFCGLTDEFCTTTVRC